jgi:hypothetical protein
MTTPINAGGLYFSYLDSIKEIDNDNNAIYGFSGSNLPTSPQQALNWSNQPDLGFSQPTSVERTLSKNFIVADTYNDRVIEFNSSGQIVQGIGSVNVTDTTFYPFSANFSPLNSILNIVLSQPVLPSDVNLNLISINIGNTNINIASQSTMISSQSSQIISIQ